jgi:ribosomal 50S subunit-recycling heat shock protein
MNDSEANSMTDSNKEDIKVGDEVRPTWEKNHTVWKVIEVKGNRVVAEREDMEWDEDSPRTAYGPKHKFKSLEW